MTKMRQSNFELLRIISMLAIVIHHYAYHGRAALNSGFNQNALGLQLLTIGGNVGVLVFAMMGAYFLCGRPFKWQRVIQLIGETYLFSWLMLVPIILFKGGDVTTKRFFELLLPFPGVYWFVDYYVLLILLVPVIHTIISRWTTQIRQAVFILMNVLIIIGPTFNLYHIDFAMQRLLMFFYIIYIMSWLNLEQLPLFESKKFGNHLLITGLMLYVLSVFSVNYLAYLKRITVDIVDMNSLSHLVILLVAFGLFISFKNIDIGEIGWINRAASACFGVYLIHEQPMLRTYLWDTIFDNRQYHGMFSVMLAGIISGTVVFIGCLSAAYLVHLIFGATLFKWSKYLGQKLDAKISIDNRY